jgi:hypothetical protein
MTAARLSALAALSLLVGTAAYVLASLFLIVHPFPAAIQRSDNGASIHFAVDRTVVFFADSCVTAEWRLEGIQSALLNGRGRTGEGRERVCDDDPKLRVVFVDGSDATYTLERTILLSVPVGAILALAAGVVLAWVAAYRLGRTRISPLDSARRIGNGADQLLFHRPQSGRLPRLWTMVAVLLLYAFGLTHWINFYNNGSLQMDSHDWPLFVGYRSVLAQGMASGEIPYFTTNSFHKTERFLASPDYPVAPQMVLLHNLTPGQFVLVDTLTFYTLGFVGCVLIKRRYALSVAVFAVLFLVSAFNGQVVAHLAIGHVMWNANFLLPFFVLFLLQMVEDDRPLLAGLKIATVLLVMGLQAAFHLALWCALTLAILAAFNRRLIVPVLLAVGFGGVPVRSGGVELHTLR